MAAVASVFLYASTPEVLTLFVKKLLTISFALVKHDVDHILHVLETLRLKVPYDLGNELLLCPNEKHALLHDFFRYLKPTEIVYCDASECTSVCGKTLLFGCLLLLFVVEFVQTFPFLWLYWSI